MGPNLGDEASAEDGSHDMKQGRNRLSCPFQEITSAPRAGVAATNRAVTGTAPASAAEALGRAVAWSCLSLHRSRIVVSRYQPCESDYSGDGVRRGEKRVEALADVGGTCVPLDGSTAAIRHLLAPTSKDFRYENQ